MKTGLFLATINPIVDPDYLHAFARAVSDGGFSSIWVGEHVVQFEEYEPEYPYADDGRMPLGAGSGLLEPFATLGFLAAETSGVRLGTGICLVPQRNPVYTAKYVSTLDWLSGGRFDFGVGVGWCREEYDALGVPFEQRGERCLEYLEVMKRLWSQDGASFEGDFYRLRPTRMEPKPVQRPHPPVYFGGESDAAMRRVARAGDGWFGFDIDPHGASKAVTRLEAALARDGRSLSDVHVVVSPYLRPVRREQLGMYSDAGVEELVLPVPLEQPTRLADALSRMSDEFVERA